MPPVGRSTWRREKAVNGRQDGGDGRPRRDVRRCAEPGHFQAAGTAAKRAGSREPLRVPFEPGGSRPLVEEEKAVGRKGRENPFQELLDRSDVVERLVKHDDVVRGAGQSDVVEIGDPVTNARQPLFPGPGVRDVDRHGGSIDRIDVGRYPEPGHGPLQPARPHPA